MTTTIRTTTTAITPAALAATTPATEVMWEYLYGVPGVVLVAREAGVSLAVIELCPRVGFRLTDCRTGKIQSFISLEEAKHAHTLTQQPV
jgi:hypothetical protein